MTRRESTTLIVIMVVVACTPLVAAAQSASVQRSIDTLLSKYRSAGQTWERTIESAASHLFWLLALISLGWTCVSMAIKQADLTEIVAELCRYIMFTGLFVWLLTNGAAFANDIVNSLRQIGGEAAGTGQQIFPMAILNLAMQVFQQTLQNVNWLQPESIVAPVIIAVLILVVCALVAVNMILLLCAAWIVLYAGLIFLGFGGCRWTSDMAINYYRTVLSVGVSLMTMELIIGIGVQFLQQLVAATSQALDPGQLGIILVAVIILAVISHRLPHIVAWMVVGGGTNGAIGGVGIMTLFAAGMTGMSLAGRLGGAPAAATSAAGAGESAKMLQDRIAAAEIASQNNQATASIDTSGAGLASGGSSGASSGSTNPTSWYGGRSSSGNPPSTDRARPDGGAKTTSEEPSLERPMSADEARGFGPDGNGGPDDQPYTPRGDDQAT